MQDNDVEVLEWLPYSPDMNCIENVLSYYIRSYYIREELIGVVQ